MDNLVELIGKQLSPQVVQSLGQLAGTTKDQTQGALGAIVPSLVGAISNQGSTAGGAQQILNLLGKQTGGDNLLGNLAGMLTGGDSTQGLLSSGAGIVSSLLGGNASKIINTVASLVGVKEGSISTILQSVAPLVLASVGKLVKDGNLNAAGLASLLAGQKGFVKASIPAGLAGTLGLAAPVEEKVAEVAAAAKKGSLKWLWWLIAALAVLATIWFAFLREPGTGLLGGGAALKVGEITDTGGIDDKTFNQTAYKGIERAVKELGIEGGYLESEQPTDYAKHITEYITQKYDLIITVGYLLGEDTQKFAEQYPDQNFAIVDYAYDPEIPNVLALTFATDQAAFMAGYLAAGMTETGKVGTFGGMEIPTVTVFMVGYANGVAYYNQVHGTDVQVLGTTTYVGNFESTDDGRRMGESLMDEGCDIVMPVAGPVGEGTAAAVKERGKMMIGVDTDFAVSAPDYKSIVLTSVLKNMDVAVFDAIKAVKDGTFKGGTYVGTLSNNGVGLAPFNDFEDKVSQTLKDELEQLRKDLIAGKIATGW